MCSLENIIINWSERGKILDFYHVNEILKLKSRDCRAFSKKSRKK